MKRAPNIWTVERLSKWLASSPVQRGLPDGSWVLARPLGLYSLRHRIKAAWLAFTGRADVLTWGGDQ
jgi:hypothetical protein